jgi:hypothetical protein
MGIKIGIWSIGMVAVFPISSSPVWAAEEEKVGLTSNLGVFNRYTFRGDRIGRDSIVFPPSLAPAYRGLSIYGGEKWKGNY